MVTEPPHSMTGLGEGSTDRRARAQKMVQPLALEDDLREEAFGQEMLDDARLGVKLKRTSKNYPKDLRIIQICQGFLDFSEVFGS